MEVSLEYGGEAALRTAAAGPARGPTSKSWTDAALAPTVYRVMRELRHAGQFDSTLRC